jgi:RNA polymerase sigma-70 factor (sigma-E family)
VSDRRSDFDDYVAARRGHMRRIAYAMCGDWHSADDIVQLALTKLYVAWPRVHRTANEDAYVRKVILRTSIDESRRPWRRERAVEHDADQRVAAAADSTDALDLVQALLTLPPRQHQVVVLRHWVGLSVAETARELGVSEGTVKSQSAKALIKLHALLAEDFGGIAR